LGLFTKKPKDPISRFIFKKFGVYPHDVSLYELAFTHKSYDQNIPNNERLEFLGDSVIDTVVAQYLYEKYPMEDEGFLTKLRSRIVSRENLNQIGEKMELLEQVRYFKGNNKYKSLEGNVFEALVGALYLDMGYNKTKELLGSRVLEELINIEQLKAIDTDYKSQLLIWVQKKNKSLEYKVSEINTDENKYLARIFIDGQLIAESVGRSKKEAEKLAAKSANKIVKG